MMLQMEVFLLQQKRLLVTRFDERTMRRGIDRKPRAREIKNTKIIYKQVL